MLLLSPTTPSQGREGPSLLDRRLGSGGEELVVVFIASTSCGALKTPRLDVSIETMKELLSEEASKRRMRFATIGVALDWDPDAGLAMLQRFGEWHEMSAGRSWLNSGAVSYVWRDTPGLPGLPQVVLLTRAVGIDSSVISVGSERLLARKVGSSEIMTWVEQGARF